MVTDVVLNKVTKRQKRQQIKGLQHRWCAYILLQSCLFGLNWSISSILRMSELPEPAYEENRYNDGTFSFLLQGEGLRIIVIIYMVSGVLRLILDSMLVYFAWKLANRITYMGKPGCMKLVIINIGCLFATIVFLTGYVGQRAILP